MSSVEHVPGSVLIVEDDALIASSLVRALEANGYTATTSGSVATAIASLDDAPPDLVLLDLGLPDGDGSVVAGHAARWHPTVPVIVLTARDSEVDVVLGLEAGAVDYVVQPFRLAELLARIASHLRMRDAHAGASPARPHGATIELDGLDVDVAARRVVVAGDEIALRPKEFDVIRVLAEAAGSVVTREQLIEEVWDENWWGSTKTLDVHINSIRRKLGEQAGEPSRITTIRGVGYRLERARPHQ
jgi:DNA-binding response OmpR family regulator